MISFFVILPSFIYGMIALFCARSFFAAREAGKGCPRSSGSGAPAPRCPLCVHHGYHPPVTILKPVKGVDADSFENFASFCRQIYPTFQIVFAAASTEDPVLPVIRRLMAEFPTTDIELVVDERIYGPNYKVCNLINAFPKAKHDIIIVCDSDIRVSDRYLQEVCVPFEDQKVGLVTSLYRTSAVNGLATVIEALGFTAEMIPNVMVALKLEGLTFALGASMAVRRQAIDAIGGFHSLVEYLADDYQLGNKVHRAGYRIELSDCFVESIMHRETLGNVLSRQLRWARTMRVSRPGGYLASGITQPIPAALLALVLSGFSWTGFAAIGLLYAVRCSVAVIFSRVWVRDKLLPRHLWLLPLRDLFAFGTWALSFLGSRVRWRGHLFRVLPGGKLKETEV